jgi:hypothetical protein
MEMAVAIGCADGGKIAASDGTEIDVVVYVHRFFECTRNGGRRDGSWTYNLYLGSSERRRASHWIGPAHKLSRKLPNERFPLDCATARC